MKKLVTLVLALALVAVAFGAMANGKVMLYSSMQEAQLQAVKEAFEAKYPAVHHRHHPDLHDHLNRRTPQPEKSCGVRDQL